MLWEEDKEPAEFVTPDNVVDLSFKIECKQVPTTHAWALQQALYAALPWLSDEPEVGIHQIHGAASGNGWERPPDGELIHLSKRSRMHLRVPRERQQQVMDLQGVELDIDGCKLKIGKPSFKTLVPLANLYSRYVCVPDDLDESAFLEWVVAELHQRDIKPRKMLCGISHTISTPKNDIVTRSLMIADMGKVDSVALQEVGVGPNRHLGCGIFVPHKGIKAVGETEDKSHFSGT